MTEQNKHYKILDNHYENVLRYDVSCFVCDVIFTIEWVSWDELNIFNGYSMHSEFSNPKDTRLCSQCEELKHALDDLKSIWEITDHHYKFFDTQDIE